MNINKKWQGVDTIFTHAGFSWKNDWVNLAYGKLLNFEGIFKLSIVYFLTYDNLFACYFNITLSKDMFDVDTDIVADALVDYFKSFSSLNDYVPRERDGAIFISFSVNRLCETQEDVAKQLTKWDEIYNYIIDNFITIEEI